MKKKRKVSQPNHPKPIPEIRRFLDIIVEIDSRYPYLFLIVIILFGLALRIAALYSLKSTIYYDYLLWDERVYHNWAVKIYDGSFKSSEVYEFAPLPAYLIALLYKIFSLDVFYVRAANIVFGTLTCFFLYLASKELINRTVGLFSALIAACYKPFILYSIVPLKTSLSILFFAITIYFLLRVLNKNTLLNSLMVGITLGVINNIRPNMIVVIPIVPLLICWVHIKGKKQIRSVVPAIVFFVLGLGIVQSPFMLRNYLSAGKTAATTSQTGVHLYACNMLEEPRTIQFATMVPEERGIQFTIEASRRVGKKLDANQASAYWTQAFIKGVFEHPIQFVGELIKKVFRFANHFEAGDHYNIEFLSDYATFFKLPLFNFWIIFPFGMAGMLANLLRSKKVQGLFGVFCLYSSTLVLFFVNIRMKLPVLVILIPMAVYGVYQLVIKKDLNNKKSLMVYFTILILFFGIEFIPVYGKGKMTPYYNTHAIILDSIGRQKEAIKFWKKSSQIGEWRANYANISLASIMYEKEGRYLSLFYLNKIKDNSSVASEKHSLIGDILFNDKRFEDAIEEYKTSLKYNSGRRDVRYKLADTYKKIDPQKARVEYQRLKYINSFYNQ